MKRIGLIATLFLLVAGSASAQNLLNSLERQAKNAVRREANKAVNDARRDARNATRNAAKNAANDVKNGNYRNTGKVQDMSPTVKTDLTWGCPECQHPGNSGKFCEECGATRPEPEAPKAPVAPQFEGDFVPGSSVIFEDPLTGEKEDTAPSRWKQSVQQDDAVIARLGSETVLKIAGYRATIEPEITPKEYLPESFTVEMDVWANRVFDGAQGQYLGFYVTNEWESRLGDSEFHLGNADNGGAGAINFNYYDSESEGLESVSARAADVAPYYQQEAWNHIALSYDRKTWKIYLNGARILTVESSCEPNRIMIWCNSSPTRGYYIKNFRLAGR